MRFLHACLNSIEANAPTVLAEISVLPFSVRNSSNNAETPWVSHSVTKITSRLRNSVMSHHGCYRRSIPRVPFLLISG